MPLVPKFCFAETDASCATLRLVEETGAYDAAARPGGYGTPNPPATDFTRIVQAAYLSPQGSFPVPGAAGAEWLPFEQAAGSTPAAWKADVSAASDGVLSVRIHLVRNQPVTGAMLPNEILRDNLGVFRKADATGTLLLATPYATLHLAQAAGGAAFLSHVMKPYLKDCAYRRARTRRTEQWLSECGCTARKLHLEDLCEGEAYYQAARSAMLLSNHAIARKLVLAASRQVSAATGCVSCR